MSKPRVSFGAPTDPSSSRQGICSTCPGPSKTSKKQFQLPALSIPPKERPLDPILERLRKKVIRRNAPKNEDIKKIKEIIRGINKEVVTVQEYVGLISPYTGDNGNVLHSVMADDLATFRKIAKRVYDTLTQDVSDVLANEQIHLTEFYAERYNIFMDKMMRGIDDIYRYVPNFDFEKYYTDKDYINLLFPLPKDIDTADPEELEMQRRQEAYHRLQWLRSEGTRLNEENAKLQARLRALKKEQKDGMMEFKRREEMAELRKNELEANQVILQNQLEDLNESVEKSIIQNEEDIRMTEDAKVARRPPTSPRSRPSRTTGRRGESWNVKTAKSIEGEAFKNTTQSAISSISATTVAFKTGTVKKMRPKTMKSTRGAKPFHFSPIKTPPYSGTTNEREVSPFHYSPPLEIPTETTRIESTSRTVEQTDPVRFPATRRGLAPRDTWEGFQ